MGSGISGGWAAKELCERGLKVLLLERDDYIKSKEKSVAPSTLQVFKNLKVILQVFQMEQIFSLCNVCSIVFSGFDQTSSIAVLHFPYFLTYSIIHVIFSMPSPAAQPSMAKPIL